MVNMKILVFVTPPYIYKIKNGDFITCTGLTSKLIPKHIYIFLLQL